MPGTDTPGRETWRDLFFGVYWNRTQVGDVRLLDVYLCVVPMLPIRFMWVGLGHQRRFGDAEVRP